MWKSYAYRTLEFRVNSHVLPYNYFDSTCRIGDNLRDNPATLIQILYLSEINSQYELNKIVLKFELAAKMRKPYTCRTFEFTVNSYDSSKN